MKTVAEADCPIVILFYDKLSEFLWRYRNGYLGLVILVGPPGTGKSRIVKDSLGDSTRWITGHTTAFGLYQACYELRDQSIVIDDVDDLYRDRDAVRLLKSLCQSEKTKTLSWRSNSVLLRKDDIPYEFDTKSRVIIISNDWESSNLNVKALRDRGHLVNFAPNALEIHRHAARFFRDQLVFDFMAENLHWIAHPSLRLYVRGEELRHAGFPDWQNLLRSQFTPPGLTRLYLEVINNPSLQTKTAQINAFTKGGGSRSMFFKLQKEVGTKSFDVPKITLPTNPPVSPDRTASREIQGILEERARKRLTDNQDNDDKWRSKRLFTSPKV